MVEVFLLGVFVAFTRLGAIATVDVGVALYAVGALMMVMVSADYFLDPEEVWETMERRGLVPPARGGDGIRLGCDVCGRVTYGQEGSRCSCCNSVVRTRRPNSIPRTWALVVASIVLYIPANFYPVLTLTRLGSGSPSTIIGGAEELLQSGMWPLALLVFVASIMVPLMKLVSLVVMLVTAQRGSAWRLHDRTTLYRLVDFIGRWSMIDVFMLATLAGLVRAGTLATIQPGLGAICFGSVVVLTMVAVSCFDPRMMWDAAEARARAERTLPDSPVPTNPPGARAGRAESRMSDNTPPDTTPNDAPGQPYTPPEAQVRRKIRLLAGLDPADRGRGDRRLPCLHHAVAARAGDRDHLPKRGRADRRADQGAAQGTSTWAR